MSIILSHDNKTEITGLTKDDVFHTVDLSSYVQEGCVGVFLQFVNTDPVNGKLVGYTTTGSSSSQVLLIWPTSFMSIIAKLDDNYQVDLKIPDSYVDVYIMAEFFEGMVLRDVDNWVVKPEGVQTGWITVTVDPLGDDTYDDIEAVLVFGQQGEGIRVFGARALGSTEEALNLIQFQIFAVPVKTNVNGQYQIYIPSEGCAPPVTFAKEIGYIKKGYGFKTIFDPQSLNPPTNIDWQDLSLHNIIDSYSTHAVIRLIIDKNTACYDVCGVRAEGSSNPVDTLRNATWAVYWVSVDEVRALEYRYQESEVVGFSVWGYVEEDPGDNILNIKHQEMNIDSGEVNIG